jgi:hypothetical protein
LGRAGRTTRWLGVALALVVCGCGGDGPSPIRLSVELSDDSFCPGGKLAGVEKPETIEVRLGVRARGRAAIELKRKPVDLKIYRNDDHTKVQQRRRLHVSMTVGETWRRPLEPIRISPPEEEGRYVLEVSTEDGAWSSTPLEIWYDAQACPRPTPGAAAAPVASAPPTPMPAAPRRTGPASRTALRASLHAVWRCNEEKGVEDLEVRVRVDNPEEGGRAERSFRPRVVGVDELDDFEENSEVLQDGYLPIGASMEFRAFGWIETGPRPVAIHLAGDPSPVVTGTLAVDCSGGAGVEGSGAIGSWVR